MPLTLRRAGAQIGSFLSCLGALRETRLTATLGFLVARFPEELLPALGLRRGEQYQVSVEETDAGDRFDLLFEKGREPVILEGKLGFSQNYDQLRHYARRVRSRFGKRPGLIVVDDGSWHAQGLSHLNKDLGREICWLQRRTWDDVAEACRRIGAKKTPAKVDPVGYGVARDFAHHLEEEGMTSSGMKEIYTRDVSDPESAMMFFRHQVWTCQPKFLNSAQGNLYFAPYFTHRAQTSLEEVTVVPLGEGISYIAKIDQVQVVPKKELRPYLRESGHSEYREVADLIQRYTRGSETLVMLLGVPYMLFPAPVTKDQLERADIETRFTAGSMGSRSLTLEELLAASRVTKFRR